MDSHDRPMKLQHLLARQGGRAALLLAAFFAPGLVYSIRYVQAGADAAFYGILWGAVGSIMALIGFALSFQTSAVGRLGRFAQGLMPVVIAWCIILFW